MRVAIWGTYDTGKPRPRILIAGLSAAGAAVMECHFHLWQGSEDKSQNRVLSTIAKVLLCVFVVYPMLIFRYLRLPKHDAVLVCYLGQFDVLVLWPFAKLRGVPIVWDAFVSMYNTVVEDRHMVRRTGPAAWLLKQLDRLAGLAADRTLLDTQAHGKYFVDAFGLPADRLGVVPVAAETDVFQPSEHRKPKRDEAAQQSIDVLFYGQFIPLHGVETIIQAARISSVRGLPVNWTIVGRGQEAPRIRKLLDEAPLPRLQWVEWVPYVELPGLIARCDVCLGIFGDTEKAARVIPNKVFQAVAVGAAIVTRDSPAIRELFTPETTGVRLVPPADPEALLAAVLELGQSSLDRPLFRDIRESLSLPSVGRKLYEIIEATIEDHRRRNGGEAAARS